MTTGATPARSQAGTRDTEGETEVIERGSATPAGLFVATKLRPPAGRRALIRRPELLATLVAGRAAAARLTLIDAPAGWGKTTLLSEWLARDEGGRAAWVSLDADDNDAVRFWTYVIEAVRGVEPDIGQLPLRLLRAPGADHRRTVLPALLGDLDAVPRRLVLALDDYHVITNARIHEGVVFLLERAPASLHLAIATRSDPPFPLGRLRVRGEITELRAGELRFSEREAAELLNDVLGLHLDADDLRRLQRRTEGWAAGLYLAALSLRGRADVSRFVAEFAGDDRHVVDYLGAEVLDQQPQPVREFLLRTSILDRLCAPLCDAVLRATGSAEMLRVIERSNLFLVPLDSARRWYRYHHLFRELLGHELERSAPDEVTGLHRRAATWHRGSGSVPEAIHHATTAGDVAQARALIAEHWLSFFNHGRLATITGWLDALPVEAITGDARLCLARVWVAMDLGQLGEAERWIEAAERATASDRGGATFETTLLRALHRYKAGDVPAARAVFRGLARDPGLPPFWRTVAHCGLGVTEYWCGAVTEAGAALGDAAGLAQADGNRLAELYARGYLALIGAEHGDLRDAEALARRAVGLSEEPSVAEHFVAMVAHLASGRLRERQGRLEEAEGDCERALDLARRGAASVEVAAAVLALARVRRARGDLDGARVLRDEADALLASCPDPGLVAGSRLPAAPKRPVHAGERLSEREHAVLRLLPGGLSQREIAAALYVSLNTVKTHVRGIYLKLDASSRAEAIAHARERGLL